MVNRYWMQARRQSVTVRSRPAWVSAAELDYHPDLLAALADLGVIDLEDGFVPVHQISRIERVFRLRRFLGVNVCGAAVILELLERLDELQEKVRTMEKEKREGR
jgi:MerR family transcriptional regulator/heat shock protein HspR